MSCCDKNNQNDLATEQDELLALGIVHTATDGTSVTHSLPWVQRYRRESKLNDPMAVLCNGARPPVMKANLSFRGG